MNDEVKASVPVHPDIPPMWLSLEPPLLSKGETLNIRIGIADQDKFVGPVSLSICSGSGDNWYQKLVLKRDDRFSFEIPQSMPLGEYEVGLTSEELILDTVTLNVVDHDEANCIRRFRQAVELESQALEAARQGNINGASELLDQ